MKIQSATTGTAASARGYSRPPIQAHLAEPQDLTQLSGVRGPTTKGAHEALQVVGMGVLVGGMVAAAAVGGKFGPALTIGALFAGMAIMTLGKD